MSGLTVACFAIGAMYMLNLRRQLREIGEEVSRMHKDFLADVYLRYGEDFDGEE